VGGRYNVRFYLFILLAQRWMKLDDFNHFNHECSRSRDFADHWQQVQSVIAFGTPHILTRRLQGGILGRREHSRGVRDVGSVDTRVPA